MRMNQMRRNVGARGGRMSSGRAAVERLFCIIVCFIHFRLGDLRWLVVRALAISTLCSI